jgi:hypothetical protein
MSGSSESRPAKRAADHGLVLGEQDAVARAVGAEEAKDLARGDREGDGAHRLQVAVRLAQAVDLDRVVHVSTVDHRRPAR